MLERPEDISRARSRLAKQSLLDLAPRLRQRASPLVLRLPSALAAAVEHDASLRTGLSAARPYGWTELHPAAGQPLRLDAYLPLEVFSALQLHADRSAADTSSGSDTEAAPVMLRVADGPWPFPPTTSSQPLAALDLLENPDPTAQRLAREILHALVDAKSAVLARRSARARVLASPRIGRLLEYASARGQRPAAGEGDPRADTQAAAAHVLGVLCGPARAAAPLSGNCGRRSGSRASGWRLPTRTCWRIRYSV